MGRPLETIPTTAIVNDEGNELNVNTADVAAWRDKGYVPVGEDPAETKKAAIAKAKAAKKDKGGSADAGDAQAEEEEGAKLSFVEAEEKKVPELRELAEANDVAWRGLKKDELLGSLVNAGVIDAN